MFNLFKKKVKLQVGQVWEMKQFKSYFRVLVQESKSCPHGHVDWDDCPDCCH